MSRGIFYGCRCAGALTTTSTCSNGPAGWLQKRPKVQRLGRWTTLNVRAPVEPRQPLATRRRPTHRDQAADPRNVVARTFGHFPERSVDRGTLDYQSIVRIPITGGAPIPFEKAIPQVVAGRRTTGVCLSPSGSPRVWIARVDGPRLEEVKDSAMGHWLPIWLPDGRLAWPTTDNRNFRIRDCRRAARSCLSRTPRSAGSSSTFSPSGDALVVFWNRKDGEVCGCCRGPVVRRANSARLTASRPIGWSADGEWVYALPWGRRDVIRVSTRTGRTERVDSFPVGTANSCALTPDRTAIICGLAEMESDAWMMENFDPASTIERFAAKAMRSVRTPRKG